jgi:hypothetical protein
MDNIHRNSSTDGLSLEALRVHTTVAAQYQALSMNCLKKKTEK